MKLLIPIALIGLFAFQCNKDYTDYSCINNKIGRIKSQRKNTSIMESMYFFSPPTAVISFMSCMMRTVT